MRDPYFCPKCREIRRLPEGQMTVLMNAPEQMAWKSFGMCAACHAFLVNSPEKAEENKALYQQDLKEAEDRRRAEIKARKCRIWVETNDMHIGSFLVATLAAVDDPEVKDLQFFVSLYKKETPGGREVQALKAKKNLNPEKAELVIAQLSKKGFYTWYETEKPEITL